MNDGRKTETSQFDIFDEEIPSFDVPLSKYKTISEGTYWKLGSEIDKSGTGFSESPTIQDLFNKGGSGVSSKSRGGVTKNDSMKIREKRSQPDKWCNGTDKISKAITVAKGDAVHLPCHSCVDHDLYEPMQWVKLHPNPDHNNLYLVKEVVPDMHDDESRNNLVINLKHSLIIRKAKKSHTASYLCRPSTSNQTERRRMTWEDMQKWIVEDSQMRYFYHLDVIDIDQTPTVETGSSSELKAFKPLEMRHENLVIYSKWLPWSACSVCDQPGTRQRIGLCVIKKRDNYQPVPHTYLNNIMKFAVHGLPCQSEFLSEFDGRGWLDRPNEIQFEECYERCPWTAHARRKKRSTISVKEMSASYNKKFKKKDNVINVIVDEYLVLKCPGATLSWGKKPVWMFGSKVMSPMHVRKATKKRVNFDFRSSLIFLKAKKHDSGVYSCWIEKKLKKKYVVRVKESQFNDVVKHGKLLCVSFLVDFVVFFILSMIKVFHRRVQVRRKPTKKRSESQQELLDKKSHQELLDKKSQQELLDNQEGVRTTADKVATN